MRRYFGLLVVLAAVLGWARWARGAPPEIIDCHVHYKGNPAFLEKLAAKMDSVNGMAFVLTPPSEMAVVRAFIQKHPQRLIGFGEISLDDPHALEQVDRFQAAGFRGLGELTKSLKDLDDPSYWPIYERADKYGMILLFHTGVLLRENPNIPSSFSSARLRVTTLDLIARKYPKTIVIGAHLGNPDYAWAAELARWNPNLYFDVSGSTLQKKSDDYKFFKSVFWWSGVQGLAGPGPAPNAFEKLVFGSDINSDTLEGFDQERARYREMLKGCDVPSASQEAIFSGNLWRILQRKR